MTEVLTLEQPLDERCANCGASLEGPFCAQCGQPVKPLDPPVRYFAGEFAQEFFDVDGRVLRSFRRLFFSPGFLTLEHVEGRRVPWLSPLKLYLLTSVACFAMLAVVGDDGGVKLAMTGNPEELRSRYGYATTAELKAAVDVALNTWMPRVMFALVPFVAWVVARVRRASGRHYPAHLVFALHVYAAGFGVRALTTAIGAAMPPAATAMVSATGLYALGYMYLAFRRAYGIGRGLAIRDTAIVVVAAWVAALAGTGAVVAVTVFGRVIRAKIGL